MKQSKWVGLPRPFGPRNDDSTGRNEDSTGRDDESMGRDDESMGRNDQQGHGVLQLTSITAGLATHMAKDLARETATLSRLTFSQAARQAL